MVKGRDVIQIVATGDERTPRQSELYPKVLNFGAGNKVLVVDGRGMLKERLCEAAGAGVKEVVAGVKGASCRLPGFNFIALHPTLRTGGLALLSPSGSTHLA